MRFLRQSLTGLILVSLTLGILALAGQMMWRAIDERMSRSPDVQDRRERVFAVNVIRAEAGREVPVLTAFGEVQSERTLEIRAKTGGTLVMLADGFVEGGYVEAGRVLARVDPAEARAERARAASDLADAEADARDAKRRLALARDELSASEDQMTLRQAALTRQRDLQDRGVGTTAAVEAAELEASQARRSVLSARRDLIEAEALLDQTANALDRARIALDEAERAVADTEISAGFAGRLSDVSVVEGRLVSANEKLADLVDDTTLEVAFRVSTPQFARLLDSEGGLLQAPMTATLDAFGANLTVAGQVTRAGAAVGEGQTGRVVFARLTAASGGLKPGDFVTVEIEEPALEDTIRLPATALGPDSTVLVLDPDQRLEAVPVTLLRRQADDILVAAVALEGRDVVAERSPLLGAGIKVRPLNRMTGAQDQAQSSVTLTDARRARLIAFVQEARDMPEETRERLLRQLEKDEVPARIVDRLETRIGG